MKKIVLVLLMVVFVLIAGSANAMSIYGIYPVSVVEKTTEAWGSILPSDLKSHINSVVSRSVGTLQVTATFDKRFMLNPDTPSIDWQCGFVFSIPGYDRPMYFLIKRLHKSGIFIGDSGEHPNWADSSGHDYGISEPPDATDIYSNSSIYGTWTIRGKYIILSGTIMRVFQSYVGGEDICFTGFSSIGFSAKIPLVSN